MNVNENIYNFVIDLIICSLNNIVIHNTQLIYNNR